MPRPTVSTRAAASVEPGDRFGSAVVGSALRKKLSGRCSSKLKQPAAAKPHMPQAAIRNRRIMTLRSVALYSQDAEESTREWCVSPVPLSLPSHRPPVTLDSDGTQHYSRFATGAGAGIRRG